MLASELTEVAEQGLLDKFKDPHSPYHIPPGTQGPESPDDPPPPIAAHSRARLVGMGYDPTSFWEQPIVWGDHDAFQRVLFRLTLASEADQFS